MFEYLTDLYTSKSLTRILCN